jgi:hypothetical protein
MGQIVLRQVALGPEGNTIWFRSQFLTIMGVETAVLILKWLGAESILQTTTPK